MMTPEQIAFELDYWRQVKTGHRERYEKMLALWQYQPVDSVLEVGTGPLFGFLPLLTAKRKVAMDPLFDAYEEAGLLPAGVGVELWPHGIQDEQVMHRAGNPFDAILSMNAIDHGDTDETAVGKMAALLKPGGRLYLHVHLRTPEQLNVGHDHCLRTENLLHEARKAGLEKRQWRVYPRDPIEDCAYRTFVAVWEKRA